MTAETSTGITLRDMVARDFRAGGVFERYGLDFCCKGDRSLASACADRGVPIETVLAEVAKACSPSQPGAPRFASWDVQTLIAYIVGNHHAYVREALPGLLAHTEKIARVHGERHPELLEVARVFESVAEEMTSHMQKEEQILFPFIGALNAARREGRPAPPTPFGSVGNPIRMMEREHESAGDAMARIRELTDGYRAPDDGCATYQACFQELEAFELDLHSHVHLENNILFPKSLALEAGR